MRSKVFLRVALAAGSVVVASAAGAAAPGLSAATDARSNQAAGEAPAAAASAASGLPAPIAKAKPGGAKAAAGDELLLFEEMPTVISASRQAQPVNWLSMPVSVVTADDIHYSGLTNLPEILQFVPGIDYGRIDRNQYAVGVRGLEEHFSDRMVTLIDGRDATNPTFGGTDWLSLPIMMEDIKRVEVTRGPAGAAWGANALNGVINVITKEPEETQGLLASTTWNQFGDSYNQIRQGGKDGRLAWRASLGYSGQESSKDALSNDPYFSQDWGRRYIFDSRAAYQASSDTRYTSGISYVRETAGSSDVSGVFPRRSVQTQDLRLFAKVEHTFDDDRRAYLQWSADYLDWNYPMAVESRALTNNLDGQYDFVPAKNHKASVGANLRWQNTNIVNHTPDDFFVAGDPLNEYTLGIFAIDRWQVNKRLAIEGQLRTEYYSATQADWAGRLTGLYSLDEKGDHIVRLGTAKAYRAPLYTFQKFQVQSIPLPSPPFPPGLFGANLLPSAHDIKNEETWSIDAGYTGRIYGPLTLRNDAYYQPYSRLISYTTLPDPTGIGLFYEHLDNVSGADSWGDETELAIENKTGKLSAWYAYNRFSPDQGAQQPLRACLPAEHKFGFTGRLFLPQDFTLNLNYRYSVAASGVVAAVLPPLNCPPVHRLDLTLAKKLGKNTELLVGVADILNTENNGAALSLGKSLPQEVPGRTVFARLQFTF